MKMKIYNNKNILIIFISLWCAIEFIISPYPYYGKEHSVFPTIGIGGLHFDLSELLIYSFIGFGLFLIYIKFLKTKSLKITLGYGYHKYLVLSFITVLLASMAIGYLNRGSEFMTMIRVHAILLVFFIFMNIYNVKNIISFIVKIVYWTGIIEVLIYLLSLVGLPLWTITIYPDKLSYIGYAWYGLYLSIFSYALLLNKIIIGKKISILEYIFIFLILLAVIINISAKPIVLGMFIVTFTTFLFYFKNNIKRVKIGIISMFIVFSPVFIYQAMNDEQKTLLIYTFSIRFLKLPAYSWSDVIDNFSHLQASGGKDISAGRFELWRGYIKDVADTPIVSDNYGHKHWTYLTAIGRKIDYPAHNSIAHYTYYAGYIAGISLVLMILYFIRGTFKYKNRLIYYIIAKKYNLQEYEFYGILAFIYAIIGNEMVGGPLSNGKFSWFWWLLVVFVLKVISESRSINNEHYNRLR